MNLTVQKLLDFLQAVENKSKNVYIKPYDDDYKNEVAEVVDVNLSTNIEPGVYLITG